MTDFVFSIVKTLQGQLVAIINIVATVGGAFVFGYKAVEYSLDEPDINKVWDNIWERPNLLKIC